MALKALLDSVDGLPDLIKKEYKQNSDGKWVLDVEKTGTFELADTGGLTKALESERNRNKTLTAELNTTKATAQDLEKKVQDFATLDVDGKIKASVAARETQLISSFETEKKSLTEKIERYSRITQQQLVENAAAAAIEKAGGKAGLLLPHVIAKMRVREEGDKMFVEIVNEKGEARIAGTQNGVALPMTVEGLVSEMKANEVYAPAFSSGKSSGSGAAGGGNASSSGKVDFSGMSPSQKLAAARNQQSKT